MRFESAFKRVQTVRVTNSKLFHTCIIIICSLCMCLQRHCIMMTLSSLPWKAASICSEVGSELVRSNVYMDMTNPGVQNPHCEPCELAIDSCILITLNHRSQTQLEMCTTFNEMRLDCFILFICSRLHTFAPTAVLMRGLGW